MERHGFCSIDVRVRIQPRIPVRKDIFEPDGAMSLRENRSASTTYSEKVTCSILLLRLMELRFNLILKYLEAPFSC
jgi:hypothetical protein